MKSSAEERRPANNFPESLLTKREVCLGANAFRMAIAITASHPMTKSLPRTFCDGYYFPRLYLAEIKIQRTNTATNENPVAQSFKRSPGGRRPACPMITFT